MTEKTSIKKHLSDHTFNFNPVEFVGKYTFKNAETAIDVFKKALTKCKTLKKIQQPGNTR